MALLLLRLLRLLFFFLLQSQLTFSLHPSPSAQLCPPSQRDALLQFKNSFQDYPSDSKIASWKENTDCCSWNGTTCDGETGHLIGLDLSDNELNGSIDSNSSLFLLSHLQRLNLAFNHFYPSNIPSEIGQFMSLTHLNLSYSDFSGAVPIEISYLSSLVSLDLSSTGLLIFKLEMPTWERLVQNLTELRELYLDNVDMTSVGPRSLMNLSSTLTALSLGGCNLHGRFPNNILHLPNLRMLALPGNEELTGYLPKSNWSSPLRYLYLSYTNFSGDLPESIGNLKFLNKLDLFGSNFKGSIPESFGNLTQITSLDLSSNSFTGSIPKSLGNLRQITLLNLSHNSFNGSIPKSLGNLTQITSLRLFDNNFTGSIPKSLGNLRQITSLDLSYNNFTGSIPKSLGNLTQITSLRLFDNNFTGSIPKWLGNLMQIMSLQLSYNSFTGSIPKSLGNLRQITFLHLSHNSLNGSIPKSLGNLTQITSLDLSHNNFTGSIPVSIGDLVQVSYVDLSSNHFNGELPSSLSNLKELTYLNLSNNNLIGRIPDLTNLTQLSYLHLSNNQLVGFVPSHTCGLLSINFADLSDNLLKGSIPFWLLTSPLLLSLKLHNNQLSFQIDEFHHNNSLGYFTLNNDSLWCRIPNSTLENIRHLDLSNNKIYGHIPKWLFDVREPLYYLNLAHNFLTGGIPSLICNKINIYILILSYNNLSGMIPQCFENFYVLDLRMNNFHGIIPDSLKKCVELRTVNFNGNRLEGKLPQSLVKCENLKVLDVGNNMITDSFPNWLETLPNLTVLILRSNRFHGPIGNSNTSIPFPKLRILDLSHNEFNGLLPKNCLENLKAMMMLNEGERERQYMGVRFMYQDSVVVTMKGLNIELVRILTVFTTIDLSFNQFQGQIPRELGRLIVLRVLNLSHNSLTDHIPSSLGNLALLESLDLSSNRLTGQIPMELTNLTFLEMLNLSQNQLVGPIPQGKQFGTFENASYGGNLGLCGFPLSQKCSTDEPPLSPSLSTFQVDNDSMFASGFSWKAVLMGYGCGFVFGVAMGYLVFKTLKPQWLVRLVEGERHRKLRKPNHKGRGRRN